MQDSYEEKQRKNGAPEPRTLEIEISGPKKGIKIGFQDADRKAVVAMLWPVSLPIWACWYLARKE